MSSSSNRLVVVGAFALLTLPVVISGCCQLFHGSPPETSGTTEAPPETPVEPEGDGWPAMPEPGPVPEWSVPGAATFTLSNGVPVTFVQAGGVPLVYVRVNLYTGAGADPQGKEGLADFTADMLNEGTASRDALTISADLLKLASNIGSAASRDYSYLQLDALEDKLDDTLAIAAEMIQQPTFTADDLERVRTDRQNRLLTRRDQLQSVGYQVFSRVLFGDNYLGRPTDGSEASTAAITREDIVDWHAGVWTADNAGIVVVGQLDVASLTEVLEKHLGSWGAAADPASRPAPVIEPPAPAEGIDLYWVDRPGASQSYITVGGPSTAFDADQNAARSLSNTVLGGNFTSRLNMNLREDKGFTYGARTSIDAYQFAGMFRARASVKAATTAAALKEFMAEIRGIVGERPLTEEEFAAAQSRAVQGWPARFEGLSASLGQFGHADATRRPEGWLVGHDDRVQAVTREQAQAAINGILDPANLTILIVGDYNTPIEITAETADGRPRDIPSTTIGEQVVALGLGPITMLDEDGNPAPAAQPTQENE